MLALFFGMFYFGTPFSNPWNVPLVSIALPTIVLAIRLNICLLCAFCHQERLSRLLECLANGRGSLRGKSLEQLMPRHQRVHVKYRGKVQAHLCSGSLLLGLPAFCSWTWNQDPYLGQLPSIGMVLKSFHCYVQSCSGKPCWKGIRGKTKAIQLDWFKTLVQSTCGKMSTLPGIPHYLSTLWGKLPNALPVCRPLPGARPPVLMLVLVEDSIWELLGCRGEGPNIYFTKEWKIILPSAVVSQLRDCQTPWEIMTFA